MGKGTTTWVQSVLLLSGIALLIVYLAARVDSTWQAHRRIQAFRSQQTRPHSSPVPISGSPARIKFDLWSPGRIRGYEESLTLPAPTVLAILRIPKIELEVPIIKGTDEISLNRGVGWILGTSRPGELGNTGIAGHRDGFFRGLKDVVAGDTLQVEMTELTNTYVVDSIEIVNPNDTRVLALRDRPSITLVTCYPFYFIGDAPMRYVIQASLESPSYQIDFARPDTKQNQENKE
jgi:sortase A